jgi:hypothetical protein
VVEVFIIHAKPPIIQCTKHGIRYTVMQLSERGSRFTMRFESKFIRKLQNMGLYNFTEIMGISWNQAWASLIAQERGGYPRRI